MAPISINQIVLNDWRISLNSVESILIFKLWIFQVVILKGVLIFLISWEFIMIVVSHNFAIPKKGSGITLWFGSGNKSLL